MKTHAMRNQELFDHMSREHGLTLLESEMHEIWLIVARTLVSLAARWRVIAQECEDVKSWVEKNDPAMLSHLAARSQAMREAADDLDKHTGVGSEANDQAQR